MIPASTDDRTVQRHGAGAQSQELMKRACRVIPGGVNSPVRAYGAVGGEPPFIASGSGARVRDVDGNEYIDYLGSWGPLLFGHSAPFVLDAVRTALESGTSFGAPTAREVDLAEEICNALPSVEAVRLVNSGTEATMTALRLARAATDRDAVIKFEGCYHGHSDSFLVNAGSGAATFGVPSSPGVPADLARLTLSARYNDLDSVKQHLDAAEAGNGPAVAAVIVEPVAGNMGVVAPDDGFLEGLRAETERTGALLIFDEVITGFRLGRDGAQGRFGVRPDLTCLGKVVGGGFPLAAVGGRDDLMRQLAPEGAVYQAGTLSGNPLAVAAGLAVVREIEARGEALFSDLEDRAAALAAGLQEAAVAAGACARVQRVASLLTVFFNPKPVRDWQTADACDRAAFGRFHSAMLVRGIMLPPAQFEATFVSAAHTDADIEKTIAAAREAFAEVADSHS